MATIALRKIIHDQAPMRFFDYMALCLYHPEHGYYAQKPQQVGRHGDFFTSVSCGPLFGILLAEHIAQWWQQSDISGPWRIIEPGANQAALAIDVLSHLRDHYPQAYTDLCYVALDPLPVPHGFQKQALAPFGDHALARQSLDGLDARPTFVIANEVLDAFPCHWMEKTVAGWQEVWIESTQPDAPLQEVLRPTDLRLPVDGSESALPLGYRTEVRPAPHEFFRSLRDVISRGRLLFFDYGFAAPEYYAIDRTRGTLRLYKQHQASEDALAEPGLRDITAHVDFSAVFHTVAALDFKVIAFAPQEFFLKKFVPSLLSQGLWQESWQNNFQTLVHPAHLGGKFHAFECSLGEHETHDATAMQRLAVELP
jgi:SAM-dependent MidA family methyltransferase